MQLRDIRRIQQAKPTREKVLTYLKKKLIKAIQVDICKRKFQELIYRQLTEIQREGEQESMFILKNITVIPFDKEKAKTHPGAENKHMKEYSI